MSAIKKNYCDYKGVRAQMSNSSTIGQANHYSISNRKHYSSSHLSTSFRNVGDIEDKSSNPLLKIISIVIKIKTRSPINISFNAFGGMLIMFPSIVKYIAGVGNLLQMDLAEEVCHSKCERHLCNVFIYIL